MFGNRNPIPLTDKFIQSLGQRSRMQDLLKARASRARSFECHDFNRSIGADVTNVWTVGATSTATTWAMLAEPGGWIRGVTGASVATGSLQLYAPSKMWNGTKGAGMATLIRLSAVTEVRVEQGFADVLPAVNTTAVNLASSSLNSITTGAVYMYDHTGSTTTTKLFTIGASTAVANVTTTTNRYDSAATLFVMMEIINRTVSLWVGDGDNPIAVVATGTNAADAWVPFIMVKTASGSKTLDLDTVWTWTNGRN